MRIRLFISFVLFVTLAVAACAGLGTPVEKPRAEVKTAVVDEIGPAAIRGRVDFEVMNPNAFGVPLRRMTYVLQINGQNGPTVVAELDQMIPARGIAPVTAHIRLGMQEAAHFGAALAMGAREYTITGHLVFATKLGDLNVAFQARGTI